LAAIVSREQNIESRSLADLAVDVRAAKPTAATIGVADLAGSLLATSISTRVEDRPKSLEADRVIEPKCALKHNLSIMLHPTCHRDMGKSRDSGRFALTEKHCLAIKGSHPWCSDEITGIVATLIEKCDGSICHWGTTRK
jgi:hypothetical protein